MLRRVLTHSIPLPRLRRPFWWLLALWPLLNLADLVTMALLMGRPGFHESDPYMAAVLAHGRLGAAMADKLIGSRRAMLVCASALRRPSDIESR